MPSDIALKELDRWNTSANGSIASTDPSLGSTHPSFISFWICLFFTSRSSCL